MNRNAAVPILAVSLALLPVCAVHGQATATFKGHKNTISCLAFSPDGKTLASAAKDGVVILRDLATGKASANLPGHKEMVTAVAFTRWQNAGDRWHRSQRDAVGCGEGTGTTCAEGEMKMAAAPALTVAQSVKTRPPRPKTIIGWLRKIHNPQGT